MKLLRIKQTITVRDMNNSFYMHHLEAGTTYELVSTNEVNHIVGSSSTLYEIPIDDIISEIIEVAVTKPCYTLWYDGKKTNITFGQHEPIPDICTLGYDLSTEHEFKLSLIVL